MEDTQQRQSSKKPITMSVLVRSGLLVARTVLRSPVTGTAPAAVPLVRKVSSLAETYFKMRGYNQYGLYEDDILAPHDDVEQAVTRLPDAVKDARDFRISRAMQCSVQKSVLPKEEWTTYEDDLKNGHYLTPYLEEIRAEAKERADWGKM